MSTFRLFCNSCGSAVDGIAYRTRCAHLFCPTCAKATFQNSSLCSVCNLQQRDIDVNEIKVGIQMSDDMLQGILFQYLLQSTCLEHIENKLNKINTEALGTTNFVVTQLIVSAGINARQRSKIELELGAQADQMADLNQRLIQDDHNKNNIILNYETRLRDSNKALMELQEAYKEKLRKCQAWEKAYNNIRGHLVGSNQSELSISSRDAAVLESEAMRAASSEPQRDHLQLNDGKTRKTFRTDVSTFRNVTTHRIPPQLLPGMDPAVLFPAPYYNRNGDGYTGGSHSAFPANSSSSPTGLGSNFLGTPAYLHLQAPSGAHASSPQQQLHQQQQNQQQHQIIVHRPTVASLQGQYLSSSHGSNAGKRSFFDSET